MSLYFSGVPGFRPGSLMNTLYRQYTLSIVRDPDDRTQKRIIITPNIGRNKIKTTQMTCKCRKQKSPLLQCCLLYPPRAFSRPLFGEPCTCPGVGHERVGPRPSPPSKPWGDRPPRHFLKGGIPRQSSFPSEMPTVLRGVDAVPPCCRLP
ncbi:hypothetical protein V8F33_009535 [Rhypophila sp. PSN 637]